MRFNLPEIVKQDISLRQSDLVKVMSGIFMRNGLRALLKLIVLKVLSPQSFGIVKSIDSSFKILTSFVEWGLDHAMVTYVSEARAGNEEDEKNRILKIVLQVKIITAVVVIIIGNLYAPQIARGILSDPGLTIYIRLVSFAVGGQLLWRYISNYLSSHQEFSKTALFLSTMPVIMIFAAMVLLLINRFNLQTIILIYLFAPAVTVIIWWFMIDTTSLKSSSFSAELMKKLFKFSRWVYVSNFASRARNQLNPVLLKNAWFSGSVKAGELNAGLYGFGHEMASEITIFSESILIVLLPKATMKRTPESLKRFLKRAYMNLVLILVPLLCVMYFAKPFVIFLGFYRYIPALPVFYILYTGAIFTIAAIPMRTVLYSMKLPHIESYLEVFMLVILVGGGIIFIPMYGCVGAAIVVLVQRVISFVFIAIYGIKKLNRLEMESNYGLDMSS